MDEFDLVLEANPDAEDVDFISRALRDYNIGHAGDPDRSDVTIFLRDRNGRIVGGLLGHINWRYLSIDKLWIEERARGRGAGTRILKAAEDHARSLGCTDSVLGTFTFQARPFYERLGYRVYGLLEGFPRGHDLYFLRKELEPIERQNAAGRSKAASESG